MNNNIYYILGVVLIVYLFISVANKRTSKRRKSRKFMEGYNTRPRQGRRDEGDGPDQEESAGKQGPH